MIPLHDLSLVPYGLTLLLIFHFTLGIVHPSFGSKNIPNLIIFTSEGKVTILLHSLFMPIYEVDIFSARVLIPEFFFYFFF